MTSFLRPLAVLLGSCLLTTAPLRAAEPVLEDTVLTGEHFDSHPVSPLSKEMFTAIWDKVVITGTNLRITCDRVEFISLNSGDSSQVVAKQNRFKSLIATGHVTIFQSDSNREATCGRAEVLPGEDRITLTESPKVVDLDKAGKPEWTWTGDKLLMLRGERRVQGENVRITAPAIKDLGFDKNKPGPVGETPSAPKPELQK